MIVIHINEYRSPFIMNLNNTPKDFKGNNGGATGAPYQALESNRAH